MKQEYIDTLSSLLKSISHPIRLKILCLLQDRGETTVNDIQAAVKTSTANISQHLTILRNQGIVGIRREANCIYNRIIDERVVEMIEVMQRLFCF
jgi:DNA-binding transcriptional ArsR family regulator